MAIEMLAAELDGWNRTASTGDAARDRSRRTSIDHRPGLNLKVAADLLTEALNSLGRSDSPVVICSRGLTAVGVGPTDLLGPLEVAAARHERSRNHYENVLQALPLETPESDLCLARWNRAELQHEQSMMLISSLRETAA